MPESVPSKEEYIEELFSSIAPRYDLLNSMLSFNLHKGWRRFAVRQCALRAGDSALDVAAGTMEMAVELARAVGTSGSVTGIDFCHPMLALGMRKIDKLGLGNVLAIEGNAERLPFPRDRFRAATIGFALRNVASVENTLADMTRVVEQGGKVVALELAKPLAPGFREVYNLYLNRILPLIGGAVNGRLAPYRNLPESVARFYSREELSAIMEKVGLSDVEVHNLTGGVVAVHVGTKKW